MPSFANLPTEIEFKILNYLADDKQALYSTIHVSQAWHEHTNNLLWQHFPAWDLAMIEGLPRRQHYANQVIKLNVESLSHYSRFRSLSFPALTEVILGADIQRDYRPKVGSVRISSYLSPTLRKLHLKELFVLTIDAMDLMCMGCPLLEDLELTCQLAFINPEEHLLHVPFNFPKLRRLVYGWDGIVSQPVMKRLSEQFFLLEYLDIGHHDLAIWRGDPGLLFPELKTLLFDLFSRLSVPDLYVISMS
jgi:hypothetical protein